ncbi:hypothetical protein GCM10022223_07370 [Kineosporia mesophila]|uniref:ANTAR domain-containing protein n=1 Tax=Kineosporia mesophila TaxID=566012 RepID=A0ABP6Z3U7_9ACTN|nr:ANTAR domain-containing protein [Kineosporia mesophila]MCD5351117.1 ANTAR domain-containing protein [Kineosporia mesophila]
MTTNPTLRQHPVAPDPRDRSVRALQQSMHQLVLAQEALAGDDLPSEETIGAVADEIRAAQDELAGQLAEIKAGNRSRRLVEGLPVAVLATTLEGGIVEANPATERLLATPVRALQQRKPVFSFVHPADRRQARQLLYASLTAGTQASGVLLLTPRGADAVPCHVTITRQQPDDRPDDREEAPVQWILKPVTPDAPPLSSTYRTALVDLSRLGVGDGDLPGLLRRVIELAIRAEPRIQAGSVLLGDPAQPSTAVSSSPDAQAGDGLQHTVGSGPVFAAYAQLEPVLTHDPFTDPRWPRLGENIRDGDETPSWLALPLHHEDRAVGVLMLYGHPGSRLPEQTAGELAPFVAAAQTLVRDSEALEKMREVQRQLHEALGSRASIDQAKGMIMVTRGCSAQEAFAYLTKMSNDSNRRVRDLAQALVDEAARAGRSS